MWHLDTVVVKSKEYHQVFSDGQVFFWRIILHWLETKLKQIAQVRYLIFSLLQSGKLYHVPHTALIYWYEACLLQVQPEGYFGLDFSFLTIMAFIILELHHTILGHT